MATFTSRSGSNDRRLVANNASHATAVGSATANAGVEQVTNNTQELVSDEQFAGPDFYVRRACFEFSLSGLTAGDTVTAATLAHDVSSNDQDADNNSYNLFHFTRQSAAGGAFDANDFNEAVGTASSTAKDISGLNSDQTFTLNAAALTHIQNAITTGYVQFSLRLSADYTPSAPSGRNSLDGYDGNATNESDRPLLTITYTPASNNRSYSFII